MRTALDLLSQIDVAAPCPAEWDDMAGDDHSRYCGKCEKNVYNLSALTAEAAITLIREKEGHLCGRYFRRADGTILTADCPVGVHHRLNRRRRFSVVAASLASLFSLSFSGCARFDEPVGSTSEPPAKQVKPAEKIMMGEVAPGNMQMPIAFAGGICAPPALLQPKPELLPAPRELEAQQD